MKHFFPLILFLTLSINLFAQTRRLDSLKLEYKKPHSPIESLKIALKIALSGKGDEALSKLYFDEAYKILHEHDTPPDFLKQIYSAKAEYHVYRNEFDSTLKILTLYERLPETNTQWDADGNIFHIASFINIVLEKYDEALKYGFKMLQKVRGNSDYWKLSQAYFDIGKAFAYQPESLKDAANYLDSAYIVEKEHLGEVDPIVVAKLAQILAKLKLPDSANKLLIPAIKAEERKANLNKSVLIGMYGVALANSVAIDDTSTALRSIDSMYSLQNGQSLLGRMLNVYQISEAYEYFGFTHKALESYKHYLILNDSVQSENKQKQLDILNKEFESAEKEKLIAEQLLKIRNKQLENTELGKLIAINTLRYEYERKQLLAKTEAERRILTIEADIKRRDIENNAHLEKARIEKLASLKDVTITKQQLDISNRRQLNFGLGTLALLLIMTVTFLWMRYKSKQKMAVELAIKNSHINTLIQELHHRVKNNMQIMSSLLSLQSNNLVDSKAKAAVNESRQRLNAMSLIHQNLYLKEDVSDVNVKNYIETLVESLIETYENVVGKVTCMLNVVDAEVPVDTVISLGLITNELVTNALKYGMSNAAPELNVSFDIVQGKCKLVVSDNGVHSMPDVNNSSGLGTRLIRTLSAQIQADVNYHYDNGTIVSVQQRV